MILQGSFKIPAFVSEHGADFIRKCLVLDPSARLKPEEMLEHPWIVSLGSSGEPRANAPRSVLDFDANFMKRALSAAPATKRAPNSLSSKFAAANISREALDSIKDELDWQYAANNVELISSGRAETTVNRSATAFAVSTDVNAPDSTAVVLSTRSFSLSHRIRRMGSNFVRRFRTRD
jgi:serine/threonine protein kinase|tara:strand:- start:1277 stop:1810 length:534 start_codon:yes stop_codon:yes gene_type:complete